MTAVAGELQSFASLSKKITNVDSALAGRVHALEKEQTLLPRHRRSRVGIRDRAHSELVHGQQPISLAATAGNVGVAIPNAVDFRSNLDRSPSLASGEVPLAPLGVEWCW